MKHTGKKQTLCAAALSLMLAWPGGVLAQTVTLSGAKTDYAPTVTATETPLASRPVEEGNPLTGEAWMGACKPVMVSYSLHPDAYPLIGAQEADWFFEMPTHQDGSTRGLALFLGEMPEAAGPVHSGRVAMLSLREAFDAGIVCWGVREANDGTSVKKWVQAYRSAYRRQGRYQYPLIDLIDPTHRAHLDAAYEGSITSRARDGHQAMWSLLVNPRRVSEMATEEAALRAYAFSDTGDVGAAQAHKITIVNRAANDETFSYVTAFDYDAPSGLYTYGREDVESVTDGEAMTYANVIVLRTDITWNSSAGAVIPLVGQGACDIFIGGTYQRGTWVRANAAEATEANSLDAPLVFFGENGEELTLRCGKTFVAIVDADMEISVETGA